MNADVIVAAAGRGARFGGAVAKQYLPLAGVPILLHSLRRFDAHPRVDGIVVVVDDEAEFGRRTGGAGSLGKIRAVVRGGPRRQESVRRGLARVGESPLVLVHDAARPLVSAELITRVMDAAEAHGAAVPLLPVGDTPKLLRADGRVEATLDRSRVALAQTPQGFSLGLLRRAHEEAERAGVEATDDAALVERLGHEVSVVAGREENLKITTPDDLRRAAGHLGAGAVSLRTGIGFDQHPLREGRRLVLGGVEIEHGSGLEGHSDADVLVHAVCDALLGAAGLGDIGAWFPDTDPRHRGAASLGFLAAIGGRLRERGCRPVNLDVTLVAEAPRIAPHRDAMRQNLADALKCPVEAISVKASRSGGIGPIGRGEGMAAVCVALLEVAV